MMTRENVAEESSDYLACQTWVALVHLHIPVIENQLDSNSNEQSYIAILAQSHGSETEWCFQTDPAFSIPLMILHNSAHMKQSFAK